MKKKSLFTWIGGLLLVSIVLTGCPDSGGGPTGPANPPQLIDGTAVVAPNPAHPGATIVLQIDYVDVSGTMNEGIVYIADNQNNNYQGAISNAPGTSGRLVTSFDLSTLVTPGEIWLSIFVQNTAGVSSNTILVLLTVT